MTGQTKDWEENFTHNITYLRKTLGLSKSSMAKLLHISVKSLDKIERGEVPENLSADILMSIGDIFCHDLDDFIYTKFGEE